MKTCFLRAEDAKLTAFDLAPDCLIYSVAPLELLHEFLVLPLTLQPLAHKTVSQLWQVIGVFDCQFWRFGPGPKFI